MKIAKKLFSILIVLLITEIITYGFAKYISDFFLPLFPGSDPINNFILALIHRFSQFALTIILLKLYFKDKLSNLGFNFNNKALSIKIFIYILFIWPIIIFLFFFIMIHTNSEFSNYISNIYTPNIKTFIISLSRDILLLDAFAEEPLYRSFVIMFLLKYWSEEIQLFKFKVSCASIFSIPIFMLSHIGLSLVPFGIVRLDPTQLILTIFTGLLFAIIFEKTKSLLCPIVAHGYTNAIITIAGFATAFFINN